MSPTPPSIRLLCLDVDGVLTDGSVLLDDHGRELKRFCTADGVGLRAWQALGFTVAIVTGRRGEALLHRMGELGVSEVIQASKDKAAALVELQRRTGIAPPEMAFLGDDWPDLSIMRRVGYPMAVANAEPLVKAAALFVTSRTGGAGAVRDAVEHLLSRAGRLEEAVRLYDVGDGVAPG